MFILALLLSSWALAADPVIITGNQPHEITEQSPAGGLPAAPGVANNQVFRADRSKPILGEKIGWTYNHHVDMGCWKSRLYVAWNSCEKDEDVWPSRELYATSSDGVKWSEPAELFPMGVSTALRMYFFHAPNGRMLAIAGLRTSRDDIKEIHKGGLVVREIRDDHSLGPVCALRPPNQPTTVPVLPKFDASTDKGFIEACNQLLANKPFLEQQDYGSLLGERKMKWHDSSTWPADEPSRPYFENRFGKAMSFFHRKDGALVAVMKWGWVLVSRDEGETWTSPVRPPTLVAGMAKVWGQRTTDGRYALFYNPDLALRYPLVQVTSDDGITFSDMRVIQGDVPPMRYEGKYKQLGPQYVRGISEWSSDGSWKDDATWIVYSMSKEDIYVARAPLGK